MAFPDAKENIQRAVDAISDFSTFLFRYNDNLCFQQKVNELYNQIQKERGLDNTFSSEQFAPVRAITAVQRYKFNQAKSALEQCLRSEQAQRDSENTPTVSRTEVVDEVTAPPTSPFDRRIGRVEADESLGLRVIMPYDTTKAVSGTMGHILSNEYIEKQDVENKQQLIDANIKRMEQMQKDDYYTGVPSLINTYAITKLYRSRSGQYLTNQKGERKWYEIDETINNYTGFSLNPTTSSIISWGNEDPYGRTPYHFTDFIFCKHWNIVPNNRMITLRRYPAPIIDNLKFPGMDGAMNPGIQGDDTEHQRMVDGEVEINSAGASAVDDIGYQDQGSGKRIEFPPMATAITYFGEETENSLNEILKFTAGLNWAEVEANMHEVNTKNTPDADAGPGGLFGGLTQMAKMFNVGQGNWNQEAVLNQGNLPPDPYQDGPYENRILGPVNRISKVKRREAGIEYENDISLTFNYVARPVGGINPKAVLLDILSNFLVIGTASAAFWGGQHRFMGNPIQYPFIGGEEGMKQWYSGDPLGWATNSGTNFVRGTIGFGGSALESIKGFFNNILGRGNTEGGLMGGLKNIFTGIGEGASGELIKSYAANKSSGQIPYLTGLKALLIGEPVGEWHVTVGNPFNPIAMIGNLICDNIEVEFGDELGPDDFPTELKVKVNLKHGMARDRDAIQSIFNRGMGRIYELPDDFKGSADQTTWVDDKTRREHQDEMGNNPIYYRVPMAGEGTTGGKFGKSQVKDNQMHGGISVWNRGKFAAISPNTDLAFVRGEHMNRSVYRTADWVKLKSLT